MNEILTIAEIKDKFNSEWVLVNDPETNESLEVQRGKVCYHSRDRDEVYREAVSYIPKDLPLYTGIIPKDTAIVL